jgi:ABC-type sugar transport system permease subunit
MTTQHLPRTRRYRPPGQLGGRTPLNGSFKRRATIVGFLAPALIILAAFVGWPMISALRLSFTDASGFGTPSFVGFANYVRVFTDPNILQDPALAMPTVVLVAVWKNFGFYMVIFLAGLQEIPKSLYEAAQLDGANGWKRFTNVTYPMLSNTMAFVVIVALIAALQAFDQIYVLTGGGPYRSTETIVMQIYQSGFKDLDLGFASALSYVLLIVTLLLSLVQFLFFGRRGEDTAS